VNDFISAVISEGPRNELREKLHLFGQFVGDWEFEGVFGRGTPDEWRVPGEWLFSWILDGTAIQDVFICPSRAERERNPHPDAEYGTTVRFYNPSTDAWDICYGLLGGMRVFEARQIGDQIVVRNKDEADGLNEWVFSDVTPDLFHWQNRTSYDQGATWQVYFELFARRKSQ